METSYPEAEAVSFLPIALLSCTINYRCSAWRVTSLQLSSRNVGAAKIRLRILVHCTYIRCPLTGMYAGTHIPHPTSHNSHLTKDGSCLAASVTEPRMHFPIPILKSHCRWLSPAQMAKAKGPNGKNPMARAQEWHVTLGRQAQFRQGSESMMTTCGKRKTPPV